MRTPSRLPCNTPWPRAAALALTVLLWAGPAAADRSYGPECGDLPVTGGPWYVDGRILGGALATHGSHFGLEAILDPDAGVVEPAAAALALHDGRTSGSGRLASLWLSPATATDRRVRFEPWGWEDSTNEIDAQVFWLDTDVFAIATQRTPVDLQVSMNGGRQDGDAVVLEGPRSVALWIADPAGAMRLQAADPRTSALGPSGVYVIGVGDDAGQAEAAGHRGLDALAAAGSAAAAFDREASAFGVQLAAAACPDVAGADDLQRLAVAALASAAYAPRGRLTRTLLSRARSMDNGFFGADVPRQAAAIASFDPALARDALLGQLEAVEDEGDFHVPYRFDDGLEVAPGSMTPVQAQFLLRSLEAGVSLSSDEMEESVTRLAHYVDWLHLERDFGEDQLLVHGSHVESGFPESPRWPFVDGESQAIFFEAPDISADFYEYLGALSALDDQVGRDDDADRRRARSLREAVEEELWDEDEGVYQDLDTRDEEFGSVITPHVLWPLAAGITLDPERADAIIDGQVLDPDRLLGDEDGPRPPMPSVAYDSAGFGELSPNATAVHLESLEAALRALFRYGREAEAERLRERILELVRSRPSGLYDRYLVEGDRCDPGVPPLPDPPVFQAGAAAAILLGVLHGDYQRQRFVQLHENIVTGRIGEARFIDDDARLFVAHPQRGLLPRVVLSSLDGGPLADRGPVKIELQPTCDVPDGTLVQVELPALAPFRYAMEGGGPSGRTDGSFVALVGAGWVVRPLAVRGGGCTCQAAGTGNPGALLCLLLPLLIRRRRPRR
jgi:mannosylglycerate hydrolase MGH1-like protein